MNSDGDKIYTKIIDLDEIVHNFFISNHLGMSTKMIPNEKKVWTTKVVEHYIFYIKFISIQIHMKEVMIFWRCAAPEKGKSSGSLDLNIVLIIWA